MSKSILCEQCGQPLPERLARKACATYQPRFCNQACFQAWRRQSGHLAEWSQTANAAQAKHKAVHGKVPGYKERRESLVRSNREHPRRSRSKQA